MKDEKIKYVDLPQAKQRFYAPVKLSKNDKLNLEKEYQDTRLLSELKSFKGSMKEFIDNKLLKNNKAGGQKDMESIVIKHNIRSRSVNGYIREFQETEALRQHVRKDNVKAFHHIISFNRLDSEHINENMLRDIARHFIELRSDNSLHVGAVHFDRDNTIHMHLIMSGVQYQTGLGNRISRQEFQQLKVEMQKYQIEKYPQLTHSLPEHGKSKNGKTNEHGPEKIKNAERNLDKDNLVALLRTIYEKSTSKEHFLSQINDSGHEVYYRNDRPQGVKFDGDRKFRFSNLGFTEKLQALELKQSKQEKSLNELEELRISHNKIPARTISDTVTEKDIEARTNNTEQTTLQELADLRESRSVSDLDRSEETEYGREISNDKSNKTNDKDSDDDSNDDKKENEILNNENENGHDKD